MSGAGREGRGVALLLAVAAVDEMRVAAIARAVPVASGWPERDRAELMAGLMDGLSADRGRIVAGLVRTGGAAPFGPADNPGGEAEAWAR